VLVVTLKDRKLRKRNDGIRRIIGVACVTDKVREARLMWYGHMQRREDDDCAKRIQEADVYGQRKKKISHRPRSVAWELIPFEAL